MLADKLRAIAKRGQYGHSRTPANFYMSDSYCSYYHSRAKDLVSFEEWQKIARLSKRYHRFVRWYKENMYTKGKVTYWMDNSISAEYTNVETGKTETRMIEAPHGDVC